MEGYLWRYIFLLAAFPWWWRINLPSCLFPEWCSALLLDTTASLNLNVHSSSAATQDKANQHHMPPRWTYCMALESFTLTHLLINITQANPGAGFMETRRGRRFSIGGVCRECMSVCANPTCLKASIQDFRFLSSSFLWSILTERHLPQDFFLYKQAKNGSGTLTYSSSSNDFMAWNP